MKVVVTGGADSVDIDKLACALAYKELLNLKSPEIESAILLLGELTESVTKEISGWGLTYSHDPNQGECNYVIVDTSDPKYFTDFVDVNKVIALFDHHTGYTDYWRERLGDRSRIEFVGACATLIWEEFVTQGKLDEISRLSARLLGTAILSNTLNFNSELTNDRDREAYRQLQKFADLPNNWVTHYFTSVQTAVEVNVATALRKDSFVREYANLGFAITIGQLELWDGREFVEKYRNLISQTLVDFGNDRWFFICPSIADKVSYIFSENDEVVTLLSRALEFPVHDGVMTTDRLLLRKDINRKLDALEVPAGN